MKLNYRGVKYNADPKGVEIVEGEAVIGHYRGADLHPHTPKHVPAHNRASNLKYRGAIVR